MNAKVASSAGALNNLDHCLTHVNCADIGTVEGSPAEGLRTEPPPKAVGGEPRG